MRWLLVSLLILVSVAACAPEPRTMTVTVYFLDDNQYVVGREPYEKAVTRQIPVTDNVPQAVLEQLFRGPTPEEQARGLRLVTSGTTGFRDFHIEDGVAHVTLLGPCNSQGATYTIANLIFVNLRQFPEIQAVKIYDEQGQTGSPQGKSNSMPFCLEP